ncbi:acetyl-CoA hydrolase/transferase family protein [Balneolaceae bacterium YR4-1]|uniref:Acetyl-CoA hydrolase/transferase family protein n=1 Tax=Halalkalibaculum roseum TaxID=2709311 RepID=A0A6M1SWS2_9BACT|nr:acetyl-CoA hydrolase/transferase family protein [Halalkalibaculum roseum]NGP77510.1 acetyl-CoA hydrolase/transferase family protein [Halalkalibaculum roseum]
MSFKDKYTTAEEAVKLINSGDRVFVHSVAAAPQPLINAMADRAPELEHIEVIHLHTEGDAPYVKPEYSDTFHTNALFVGSNVRKAVNKGSADYLPIFLSEVPGLFRKNILPIDMALVQVSPPDKHGYCSLGVSVDASRAALQSAKKAIALVNPNMPRTHGDGIFHASRFNALVETDEELHELNIPDPTKIEQQIGNNCAELVEDGATLQMGIGAIPNAVLKALGNHKDLGIHTEMFSDGVIELVEKGVITGKKKAKHPEKIVASFVMGSRELYDFVDDNPMISMLDVAYVNDTAVIRKNPKVTAINSAIEVDITGQVCADSIGTYHYSGVGGQMDFIRGASLSEGGKPIIALPSVTGKGESKIVPHLKQGAGVVTTRAHVHYVVTEYGVANLYGKNLHQRAKALIDIAHPDHRESLKKAASERFNKSF